MCRRWCSVPLEWRVIGLPFRSYKESVHLDDWGNFQSSFVARGFKCTFGPVPIKPGWRVTIWVMYWSELFNIEYDKSEDCTSCCNVSGIVCLCIYIYLYIYITTIYIYYVHTHTYIHSFINTPDTFQHHLKSALSSHGDEIISVHIFLHNNTLNCTQYSGPQLSAIW